MAYEYPWKNATCLALFAPGGCSCRGAPWVWGNWGAHCPECALNSLNSLNVHSTFICSEVVLLVVAGVNQRAAWSNHERQNVSMAQYSKVAAVCCSSSDKFCGTLEEKRVFPDTSHYQRALKPENITWMWCGFIKSKLWSLPFPTLGPPVTFAPLFRFPFTTQTPVNSGRPWGHPHPFPQAGESRDQLKPIRL